VAPETSKTRNRSLPPRLMPPIRCLPPVERSFGVRPAQAARWRPDSNVAGSISIANVNAIIGLTPGLVASRWLSSLALGAAFRLVSTSLIRFWCNLCGSCANPELERNSERKNSVESMQYYSVLGT
jgi:hypothetical protein